ncbi:PaaI family thioesterase [Ferrovibrio sp.]|uniref:PaaI family thioesterase n=1 Tax=Ferrovibrio sp. TaxID=1917215 RepID=UPI00311E2129
MTDSLQAAAKLIEGVLLRQPFMQMLGVTLEAVGEGEVELRLALRPDLTQHGGVAHGGVIGALADNAAGAAAGTLTLPEKATVTAEYKINFIAPGAGDALRAVGRVLKPGRSLIAVESRVYALRDGTETLVAAALASMVPVPLPPRG